MRSLQRILMTISDRTQLQAVIDRTLQQAGGSRPDIDDLQRELDRAELIPPTLDPSGVVTMNSTVRLRDLDSDEIDTYTLVFPQDADIQRHCISILAPVGTAIIGSQRGDVVTWSVPRGRVRLRIEEVIPPDPLSETKTAVENLCHT